MIQWVSGDAEKGERGDVIREKSEPPRNLAGQRMGAKGLATRQRIIDALHQLLLTHPLRDIKASHITQMIGAAPSRFGLYFSDVEEALLAAIESHPQASGELMDKLTADWEGEASVEAIRNFVTSYLDYWEQNFDLLKARNLAADEGDPRFLDIRRQHATPLREELARKVARAQAAKRLPDHLHPSSVAGVILSALERMTAITRYPHSVSGVSTASLVDAAVYMIGAMTGTLATSIASGTGYQDVGARPEAEARKQKA